MTEPTDAEIADAARKAGLLPDNSHPAPETRATRRQTDAVQAFARAVLAMWGTPATVKWEPEFDPFLSDVMTAAGLVTHGKQCKQLGERLGAAVMKLRAHGIKKEGQHGTE